MKTTKLIFLLFLAAAGFLPPCFAQKAASTSVCTKTNSAEVLNAFQNDPNFEYTLQKGDKIKVNVWENDGPEESTQRVYASKGVFGNWLMLDACGEVSLPKIGDVKLEGLTIAQASEKLASEFKGAANHPVADIRVINKMVTIMGEMKSTGIYVMDNDSNSLTEVLAKGGDFDQLANKKKIQVIRVIDFKLYTLVVDLTKENNPLVNVQIHPGDIVYVPSKKSNIIYGALASR